MKIHEKIVVLRKRQGWSQEMLAEKLCVSRQAVSKWETGESLPELSSIVRMAEIFSVTTDELLRDGALSSSESEPSQAEGVPSFDAPRETHTPRREEVEGYIEAVRRTTPLIAVGVLLCILSPITLLVLIGLADAKLFSEGLAVAVGLGTLIFLVAVAVALFVPSGIRLSAYDAWKTGKLVLPPSMTETLREEKQSATRAATVGITVGVVLCVLSPIPLLVLCLLSMPSVWIMAGIGILLFTVACGVYVIVRVGVPLDAYHLLFRENDYSEQRGKSKAAEMLAAFYWPLLTAAYLLVSFLTGEWGITWLFWPVGALLFGAAEALLGGKSEK